MRYKLKRFFTIFIVPHDGHKPHSFKVPLWVFKAAGISFIVFAASFLVLFYNVGSLKERVVEFQDLLTEQRSEQEDLLREKRLQEEEFLEERRFQEEKIKEITRETEQIILEIEEIRELKDTVYEKVDGLDPPENGNDPISYEGGSPPAERLTSLSRGGYPDRSTELSLANAESNLEVIQASLSTEKESLEALISEIDEHNRRLRATPSIRPAQGIISSGFGYRRDPITRGTRFHSGVDINNSQGTPVYAAAYGRVISAGYSGGYGNMVVINHGYGYQTCYAHLSRFAVSPNQQVSRGQLIGYMGRTGRATGSHLHYEVRVNGSAVNPSNYF